MLESVTVSLNFTIISQENNLNWTSTTETNESLFQSVRKIISYMALLNIVLALLGNTSSLLIFRLNKELKTMPSIAILSFVCISDTLSLLTWNLDEFTFPHFNFDIEYLSIYTCKIFQPLQYISMQSSAFLLSFCCIDRYFAVISKPGSFAATKLPLGSVRWSVVWSVCIILFITLANSFLFLGDRKKIINATIDSYVNCYEYENGFRIGIIWDKLHLCLYSLVPFVIMVIFNGLLVRKTLLLKANQHKYSTTHVSSHGKMRNLTFSLLFITFTFMVMTMPVSVIYSFFGDFFYSSNTLKIILTLLNYMSFLNRSSMFFNCYFSNKRFRKIVKNFFIKPKQNM
jgi:hypothetical protein